MTHADLVRRAVKWLRNSNNCHPVMTRQCVMVSEQPDAIGWQGVGKSILIECKVSRADFFRDMKKSHRQRSLEHPQFGIGNRRYYLAESGLLKLEEIPKSWGLLEVDGKRILRTKESPWHGERNHADELRLLISLVRNGSGVVEEELDEGCLPDVGL